MNSTLYYSLATSYGAARAVYWLHKVNDETMTTDGTKKHPPTLSKSLLFTALSAGMSPCLWPIFIFNDISRYEKSKMEIRDKSPPYPFENFTWRDEK